MSLRCTLTALSLPARLSIEAEHVLLVIICLRLCIRLSAKRFTHDGVDGWSTKLGTNVQGVIIEVI